MNDIEVLRRVRAGNTKAYEELVVKYEKRIFQVALEDALHKLSQ